MATAFAERPQPAIETWYTVNELMALTKFGRTFLYGEMERGALKSKKVGGSRRVSESQLAEWQGRFNGSGETETI